MASELKVDKFTGVTTAGSILVTGEGNSTTTNLQQGLCKAWANADAQSTVHIDDSFNHASITDSSTGQLIFNVTNALANADFSISGSHNSTQYNFAASGYATTSITTFHRTDAGSYTDPTHISVNFVGDLA